MIRALLGAVLVMAGCNQASEPRSAPTSAVPVPSASASSSAAPTQGASESTSEPATPSETAAPELAFEVERYPVPAGSGPHDVAPAVDGGVWYTAQGSGELGWLDPETGEVVEVPLGGGSSPHGVIVGPEGDAWVTDSGLNAIVRVDAETHEVEAFPLPESVPPANLNTATFGGDGVLWFTGQAGWYGSLDPSTGEMRVFPAPGGIGPYGIATTPDGDVWFSSLAGRYLADVDEETGDVATVTAPSFSGLRRVWADSTGRLWVSEWDAGQVGVYDPTTEQWQEWRLPGDAPQTYSVYVDETDAVWLTDFGANAIVRFDPATETFTSFPAEHTANVRQMLGRPGEVWGAESAADQLVVIRYGG